MAYNEKLVDRIRKAVAHLPHVKEKKMFGSLAFMVDDKMCITAGANRIMCRIDPTIHEEAINSKGCSSVIMKGREYKASMPLYIAKVVLLNFIFLSNLNCI